MEEGIKESSASKPLVLHFVPNGASRLLFSGWRDVRVCVQCLGGGGGWVMLENTIPDKISFRKKC